MFKNNPPTTFMYYVYLLKSEKDNKLYIGLTNNLRKRLFEHNQGLTKSTRYRRPLRLVYYEAYVSLRDAKIREQKLKKFKNSYTELKKRITNSLQGIKSGGGKGVSLYLVILISTFILAVALGLSTILISRIKVSQEIGYSVIAFYAADTGIERILYDIRKLNYECSSPPCTPYSNIPLDSASYGVVINSWSPSVQINSTGKYQTVKRAIEINY